MYCEVECAARIFGEDEKKIKGWLDGGFLKGTFTRDRWLADTADVLRLHQELFVQNGRRKTVSSDPCPRQKLCDDIAGANLRMIQTIHTPKRAKQEKKLEGLVEELSIIAPAGLRPPPPKKKTKQELRKQRERVDARMKANHKKREQMKNAAYFERFRRNIDTNATPRSIADKRYWWNEE